MSNIPPDRSPLVIKSTLLAVYGRYVATVIRSHRLIRTADQLEGSSLAVRNNIAEAQSAESRRDFIHKLKLAHKELFEVQGIAGALAQRDGVPPVLRDSLIELCGEINRILSSSISTATRNGRNSH